MNRGGESRQNGRKSRRRPDILGQINSTHRTGSARDCKRSDSHSRPAHETARPRRRGAIASLDIRHSLGWNEFHVLVAQLDRASASEAEGCRFDSCRAH
jgi:hypothetical protein